MANSYRDALERIRRYVEVRDKLMPLRGLDSIIHGIHGGTEYEAQITLDDLRAIVNGSEPESIPLEPTAAMVNRYMEIMRLGNIDNAKAHWRAMARAARECATSGSLKDE